ncbi:hypothetical protein FS837_001367 [Tulasnella sp. UAMH 9824]|nr:hypothetical protein FS837_001367 [Tulasnella sp. UAMH 9824]
MAPTGVTDRAFATKSHGVTITSAAVKKGRPTVVKYSWTYNSKKSPAMFVTLSCSLPRRIVESEYIASKSFFTFVFNIETEEQIPLGDSVITRDHGKDHTGTLTLDITELKNKPGKYLLLFVLLDE